MTHHEPIRTLYSRSHGTIYPGLGVFLAGPTGPDDEMLQGWRRTLIARLVADERLDPMMTVVAPEPESGRWADIVAATGKPKLDQAANGQIAWEWQYLGLCDVTVFWLATYWDGNIGPTTRWEFGYYLQEYLKNRSRRTFLIGAPADAESVKWPRRMIAAHGLPWHTSLESLGDAVAETLLRNRALAG